MTLSAVHQYKLHALGIGASSSASASASSPSPPKSNAYDRNASDAEESLNSVHFLAMGAFAKLMSTSITYPLQVCTAFIYLGETIGGNSQIKSQK